MVSHKRKYCTNNKSKKLLTIMNTKLDLIQKSLDDLHKEHADASMPTGLSDSSATLDSDSNASMYQSDVNSSASSTESSGTESSDTETSGTESPVSESPVTESSGSDTSVTANESLPAGESTETEMSDETPTVSSTDASSTDVSSTEASSLSPIVAPAPGSSGLEGSEESTPSWMNESPKEFYGERQPETPPNETKKGGNRRIRKSKRQQRQYLRNKSRNRRM